MSDDNVAHQIINNCIERSMNSVHINIEKEKIRHNQVSWRLDVSWNNDFKMEIVVIRWERRG